MYYLCSADPGCMWRLVEVACQMGFAEHVPSLDEVKAKADETISPTFLSATYNRYTNRGHLKAGNLEYVNEKLSGEQACWACYGPGFNKVQSSLVSRIVKDCRLLINVLYYSVRGGHYDVAAEIGVFAHQQDYLWIFKQAMQNVFNDHEPNMPEWDNQREVIIAIEFFRSLGFTYETISSHSANDAFALEYLLTRSLDWGSCAEDNCRNWKTSVISLLLHKGLLKWKAIMNNIATWTDSEDRRGLLDYVLKNGIVTREVLLAPLFGRNNYQIKYVDDIVTMAGLTTPEALQIIDREVTQGNGFILSAIVANGLVGWQEVMEKAISDGGVNREVLQTIARFVIPAERKRRKKRAKLEQNQ